MSKHKEYFEKFKWPLFWIIVYVIIIFAAQKFVGLLSISDSTIRILIVGYLVALIGSIIASAILSKRFHIGASYLFWGFLYSWLIWFVSFLANKGNVSNELVVLTITAIIMFLSRAFLKKTYPSGSTKIALIIILMVIYFLISPTNVMSEQNSETSSSSMLNSIKEFFSSLSSSVNSCPQLNVYLEPASNNMYGIQTMIFVKSSQYQDWTIKKHQMTSFTVPMVFGAGIPCVRGKSEGQNANYMYCGSISGKAFLSIDSASEVPYMEKTEVSSDGTIGKTIRKGFRNIYDANGYFVKTECFEDPLELDKRNTEEFARWLIENS